MRLVLFVCTLLAGANARADDALQLEARIGLGSVTGRIDHLAVDLARRRLFVDELGNDSVDVVDLAAGKAIKRLDKIREPQGIGFAAPSDTLYVASGADGAVHLFQGESLAPSGDIRLGDDADNIHVGHDGARVYVGFGGGAIAVIDTTRRAKVADIVMPGGHPEGFQLDAAGQRLYVNLPERRRLAIADLATNKTLGQVVLAGGGANFALALDELRQNVLIASRNPSRLDAYSMHDGTRNASVPACGDADDVFVDAPRRRVYLSCGEGFLDVFAIHDEGFERIAHLRTAAGARTALYVPELDRLFLGVRASGTQTAAVWVFRPTDGR